MFTLEMGEQHDYSKNDAKYPKPVIADIVVVQTIKQSRTRSSMQSTSVQRIWKSRAWMPCVCVLTAPLLLAGVVPESLAATVYLDSKARDGGDGSKALPYNNFLEGFTKAKSGDTLSFKGNGAYLTFASSSLQSIPANKLPLTVEITSDTLRAFVAQDDGTYQVSAVSGETAMLSKKRMTDCAKAPSNPMSCPVIITQDSLVKNAPNDHSIMLEPSALVWSTELKMMVGVTDNLNDLVKSTASTAAPGYVVFAFNPDKKNNGGNIVAIPLFQNSDALNFKPYDLEGITVVLNSDGTNTYYAIGSLSLHASKLARDTWFRFQMIKFNIDGASKKAVNVAWVSADGRRDIREWFASQSNIPWNISALQTRPETAQGMNVEGLGSDGSRLLVGFRGPLFQNPSKSLIAEIAPPSSSSQPPGTPVPYYVSTPPNYGIRGILQYFANDYYLITGPTDTARTQLELVVYNAGTGYVSKQFSFSPGFVAEGIGYTSNSYFHIGVADDLNARYMEFWYF